MKRFERLRCPLPEHRATDLCPCPFSDSFEVSGDDALALESSLNKVLLTFEMVWAAGCGWSVGVGTEDPRVEDLDRGRDVAGCGKDLLAREAQLVAEVEKVRPQVAAL